MAGQLIPPPEIAPEMPADATPTQCIAAWMDLMRCGDTFLLAGMRMRDEIILKLVSPRVYDHADAAYLLRFNRDTMNLSHLLIWIDSLKLTKRLVQVWDEAFPGESPPGVE